MTQPQVSLFLTTYNWPKALALVLQSIAQQTILPNEVIIADDGSKEETKNLIDQYKKSLPFPLIHCWQEDNGYRINAIRNKAIKQAKYPYIIQLDGDMILHPNFIADHLSFARKERFIIGRRLQLTQSDTLSFCENQSYTLSPAFRNKLVAVLHQQLLYDSTSVRGVRGCNLAFWKEDANIVNGYDEDMTSKGPNDKEFCARLVNAGIKAYNLKFYANAFHLHHGEEGLRSNYEQVNSVYQETLRTRKIKCKNGLTKLS